MFRRQFINTIRRYSHQHCEKNIPQINSNHYFQNNEEKLDLIQKQLWKNNEEVTNLHGKLDIFFTFNFFTTIALLIKSV
jgi:hypothetical protein